jgi:UDP-perosamine 4-acetyltransferase
MSDALILFGSGGHAKVVLEAVRARTPERRVVVIDDNARQGRPAVLGEAVCGGREWLASNLPRARVALGVGDNFTRAQIMEWLAEQGRELETVIHPAAIVGRTTRVGDGSFVAAGAIVIADARLDRGAIVNTAASIDHDCTIGTAAHIAPGARLCGNVRVGARTLIGVGSAVCPGVSIGADVIVGAGSSVIRDLPERGTYAGCPARRIGDRA